MGPWSRESPWSLFIYLLSWIDCKVMASSSRGHEAPIVGAMKPHRSHLSSNVKAALIGVASAVPSCLYAADRVVAGRWEFTMTTDGVPRVLTSCMSTQDAAELNADTPTGKAAAEKKAGARCMVKSYTANGNSLDYTLVCGPRTIHNATVFQGESSQGTTTTTFEGVTTTTQIRARRVGACA